MIQTVGPSASQLAHFLQKVSIRLTGWGKVMMTLLFSISLNTVLKTEPL